MGEEKERFRFLISIEGSYFFVYSLSLSLTVEGTTKKKERKSGSITVYYPIGRAREKEGKTLRRSDSNQKLLHGGGDFISNGNKRNYRWNVRKDFFVFLFSPLRTVKSLRSREGGIWIEEDKEMNITT